MTTRRALVAVLGAATLTAAGVAAPAGAAAGGCVGGPGCSTSLQAAVDAAAPGTTIRIAEGTYAGGVRIAKSLSLVGAGSGRTVIRGGGPVLTIETPSGTPPTVVLSDLTVTGGVSHTPDPVNAFGGGILVAPGPDDTVGATVTLRRVVVRGNRTAPSDVIASPGGAKCPDGDCPYAGSRGGGIASFGHLTLERSVVTRNRAGGTASDANGGGIWAGAGTLTIRSSVVSHNAADPDRIGRFAEGGGIFTSGVTTTIEGSSLRENTSRLVTSWPIRPQGELLELLANGGGIHVANGGSVTVRDSRITGNRVVGDDPAGEIFGFGTGILVDDGARVDISRTSISHNRLVMRTAASDDVGPSGLAAEIDTFGVLTDVKVTENTATVIASDGEAQAAGGLGDFADNPNRLVLTRVVVRGNTAVARSATSAKAFGGGILNNALMDLHDVTVHGNSAAAYAPNAQAQGGGIWNGPLLFEQDVELTATGSRVTGNAVIANGAAQGGGIFNSGTVALDRTLVAKNRPDQCVGCP